MEEPTILQKVILGKSHQPTGETRHFVDGAPLPPPYELRIVQYKADPGFYLFYCNESGEEKTDTYHASLADAIRQAEREFDVVAGEWEIVHRKL